jgi:MarR family transcriptional regulator, negative regulator of the multidrug operon emrRAB
MNGSDLSASAAENRRIANLLGAVALEAVGQIDAAAGEVTGLSRSGVAALVALVNFASELPQSELQAALGLSQPATTRVVDRLVEEGLVARTRNIDGDGRELRLAPTRAGRAVAKRVGAARMGAMTDLVESLPAERRASLGACMELLLGELTEGRRDSRRICRLCEPGVCGHPQRCPVTLAAVAAQGAGRSRVQRRR